MDTNMLLNNIDDRLIHMDFGMGSDINEIKYNVRRAEERDRKIGINIIMLKYDIADLSNKLESIERKLNNKV